MADKLGIVVPYGHNEQTEAARYIADLAYDEGSAVSIFSTQAGPYNVSPFWDTNVTDFRNLPIQAWFHGLSTVLWLETPRASHVRAASDAGAETAAVPYWEQLVPTDKIAFALLDKILIPYKCVGESILERWKIKAKPIGIPWDVPQPVVLRQTICDDIFTLFVPLYDTQPQRCTMEIFETIETVLSTFNGISVIFATGTCWTIRAVKALKFLMKLHPGRIRVVKKPDEKQRREIFTHSNLMVWTANFESLALVGLNALYMGVPIIAWDIAPHSEYLRDGYNSMLVPCEIDENWLGVPEVSSDSTIFRDKLLALLQNKPLLARMVSSVHTGLECRKTKFREGWAAFRGA